MFSCTFHVWIFEKKTFICQNDGHVRFFSKLSIIKDLRHLYPLGFFSYWYIIYVQMYKIQWRRRMHFEIYEKKYQTNLYLLHIFRGRHFYSQVFLPILVYVFNVTWKTEHKKSAILYLFVELTTLNFIWKYFCSIQ